MGEGKGRRPFPSPTPPLYPISGGVSWGAAVASPPSHAAGWGEFFIHRLRRLTQISFGGVSWGAAVASPSSHVAGWGEFLASREGAKETRSGLRPISVKQFNLFDFQS